MIEAIKMANPRHKVSSIFVLIRQLIHLCREHNPAAQKASRILCQPLLASLHIYVKSSIIYFMELQLLQLNYHGNLLYMETSMSY